MRDTDVKSTSRSVARITRQQRVRDALQRVRLTETPSSSLVLGMIALEDYLRHDGAEPIADEVALLLLDS